MSEEIDAARARVAAARQKLRDSASLPRLRALLDAVDELVELLNVEAEAVQAELTATVEDMRQAAARRGWD